MAHFRKIRISDSFVPEERSLPVFPDKECLHSYQSGASCGKIFFLPSALTELDRHIHWGQKLRDNIVEQGGYLLGNVYCDPGTQEIFAIIEHLVPVLGANGTATHLSASLDVAYATQLKEQEIIQQHNNTLHRIGSYHTHPGGLDVFMSHTDMETQTTYYFLEWQFAVVLNPQRRIWRAFRGGNAYEADCIFVCDPRNPHNDVFRHSGHNVRSASPCPAPAAADFTSVKRAGTAPGKTAEPIPVESEPPAPASEPSENGTKARPIRVMGEHIYVGEWKILVDNFVDQILSSLNIDGDLDKIESLCVHTRIKLHEEDGMLRFSIAACNRQFLNLSSSVQISWGCEEEDDPEGFYAVIHYRPFKKDKIPMEMAQRMEFKNDRMAFCVFSPCSTKGIRYYICDSTHNYVLKTLEF